MTDFDRDIDTVTLTTPPRHKTTENTRGLIMKPALEENCNEMGHVEAGHLLKLIDVAGVIPPFRHVDGKNTFVTASLDRTNFINPIRTWEFIQMESRISRIWKTSLETEVKISALDFRHGRMTKHPVATAHLVYVALDKDRKKVSIDPIALTSREDYKLAHAADLRKANRVKEEKQAPFVPINEDDGPYVAEITREMTPKEANIQGNVFGGVILEAIEEAGRKAAKKQALDSVVTGVRIDRMSFLAPGFVGETVRARAIVTKTWKTSMEVQVEVEAVNPNDPQHPRKIADSYLVYVRLNDKTGKPAEVPPWSPKTDAQKKRAEAADLRREIRKQEEEESTQPVRLSTGERFMLFWQDMNNRLRKSWAALTGQ